MPCRAFGAVTENEMNQPPSMPQGFAFGSSVVEAVGGAPFGHGQ